MTAGSDRRRAGERRGRAAEWMAAWYLRLKGYRVLARRFRGPGGEIDLIVKRGRLIAFVEVKARSDIAAAAGSIAPRSQARIVAAARAWLANRPEASAFDIRFDAVLIVPGRLPHHLMGAFDAGRAP